MGTGGKRELYTNHFLSHHIPSCSNHFYTQPDNSGRILWFHVGCSSVISPNISVISQLFSYIRLSIFLFSDMYLSKNQWIFTWYVHWYCGDLVWDCEWANFVNFWQLSARHTLLVQYYCFMFFFLITCVIFEDLFWNMLASEHDNMTHKNKTESSPTAGDQMLEFK